MSDESADARDRVVDVLRKFVAENLADLIVGLTGEVISCGKPARNAADPGGGAAPAKHASRAWSRHGATALYYGPDQAG